MYERFTDRASNIMQMARQEAQRFNHEYIGTEHILLALIKEGGGVATNVLVNLDFDLRRIRRKAEKLLARGPVVPRGKLPMTPRAMKVIEHSIETARELNHDYVGSEHILMGLLREDEGVAAQVLTKAGVKLEEVTAETQNLLGTAWQETGSQNLGSIASSWLAPTLVAFLIAAVMIAVLLFAVFFAR